jgi:hypothetical protein
MAQIGLTRAGQKPARFAGQRTGHRPLSNPAALSARSCRSVVTTALKVNVNVSAALDEESQNSQLSGASGVQPNPDHPAMALNDRLSLELA